MFKAGLARSVPILVQLDDEIQEEDKGQLDASMHRYNDIYGDIRDKSSDSFNPFDSKKGERI